MKRVLIVDDSEGIRRLVGAALRSAGYETVEAADGIDGLAVARATQPTVVLCDINMPRMGGMEMLRKLSREAPDATVIMLTTEAQPSLIRHARELGAKGWIVKPFKTDLLVAAVNKLVP